jgi:hypothetical protein
MCIYAEMITFSLSLSKRLGVALEDFYFVGMLFLFGGWFFFAFMTIGEF